MPGSTCLHIQDRESGPIRVVELPWISVRIGRAAYCEVRLSDADLPDEVCRLTRRGRSWSLVPTSTAGPILLDGRRMEGPCPLPFDVPVLVGPYCLTLRNDLAAEPDWELYPANANFGGPGPLPLPTVEPRPIDIGPVAPEPAPMVGGAGRAGVDPDRWRARWKAAEAHLKARSNRLEPGSPRPTPAVPTPPDAFREVDRPEHRPAASPPPRPVPTPGVARIEPAWNTPRPDPGPPPPPRPGPVLRPAAPVAAVRPEPFESPAYQPPAFPVAVEAAAASAERGDLPAAILDEPTAPAIEDIGAVEPEAIADEPVVDVNTSPEPPEPGTPAVDEPIEPAPSPEADAPPPRAMARGPRRRRPRERSGAGRRGDPARRLRSEPEVAGHVDDPGGDPAAPDIELPSVRDILENHRNSPGPRPAVVRSARDRAAVPTVPQEPAQWSLPGWLALPPVGAFMLSVGVLCCVLCRWWTVDARVAAEVSRRLLASDGSTRPRPMPPEIMPPDGQWIRTTAQHMANWAIYTASIEKDQAPTGSDVPTLVTQALEISPLNPTARLAMTQLEGPGRDVPGRIRGLGLSRDSVSLAWSAKRLLESGRKGAALRLYHRAIAAAVGGGLSRSATPRFSDDEEARRYYLPSEGAVRDILAELAGREELPFEEWSKALPRDPTVLLATARLLRDRGDPQADSLLDELLGGAAEGPQNDARRMAARAEAMALRSRWGEAAEQYRQAIEAVDNDLIRRSWWFNLADIADRLDDERQRQAAFRAVLAARNSDDISRRVGLIQRSGAARARAREGYGTVKAN